MRAKWIVAIAVVVAAAAGAGIFYARSHKPKPAPVVANVPPPAPAEITLTGVVAPRTTIPANAPIAGVIDALFLDVNQEVYKDQLLGKIKNPQSDTNIAQAQAELDREQARVQSATAAQLAAKVELSRAQADQNRAHTDLDRLEKDYQRQKGLWDLGATPRLTFEKAEKDYKDAQNDIKRLDDAAKNAQNRTASAAAEVDAANQAVTAATAALEQARNSENEGEIHSPSDGIVAARHGAPGEMVELNADVFDIAPDPAQLQVTVPASPEMRAGQAVTVDGIPGAIREVAGNQAIIDFTSPTPGRLGTTAQVKIKY